MRVSTHTLHHCVGRTTTTTPCVSTYVVVPATRDRLHTRQAKVAAKPHQLRCAVLGRQVLRQCCCLLSLAITSTLATLVITSGSSGSGSGIT